MKKIIFHEADTCYLWDHYTLKQNQVIEKVQHSLLTLFVVKWVEGYNVMFIFPVYAQEHREIELPPHDQILKY